MSKKEKKTKQKPTKLEKTFKKLHFFEKYIYRVFCPYERHGNLSKYEDTPIICIGNHYSYMDVVFPCLVTDRPIHFIAKQELYDDGGFMKWFVKKCECILVKRDGSDVQAIKDSMRILKAGGVINIFPEGTRNHSYAELLPFHGDAAALSIKTQTPIIPIVKVTKIKLFKKTHVIFGDPIEFRQYYGKKVTKEQIEECDNVLREAMTNMRLAFLDKHPIKFKSDKV
ncbi:MAG: 1-acyl-sn-glycerol-3-phosphate acyltransferase [Clostridia bacterium]|nr:1-acyl-sn-glycerol-3-phosphate acyltransferase [Clostridia bacterium]